MGGPVECTSKLPLEDVFAHLAHPIFVKDRDSRWVLVNRAFCHLVGATSADLLGRTDSDFFPPEQAAFFLLKDREVFDSAETRVIDEEPITDLHGVKHLLQTTKVPLLQRGVVTHLVGIIHDITETRTAQRALEDAKVELEERVQERTRALEMAQDELLRKERLAVLGQLTGGLAHQIRNPLSAILNASRQLRRLTTGRPEDQKELESVLGIIDEEVWSANRIVTDLIDYARVKEAHRKPVALRELLTPLLAQLPPEIQIDKRIPAELPLLDVDGPQVSGALGNLLRNAHEAMPLGGFLKIEAKREGVGRVAISLTDSGSGLSNQALGRLFEPLVTTKPLGLGLGLVTAKSLIENQGGRLEGGNVPGSGARFTLLLPCVV